jgi:hypothetical protein
MTAGGSFFFGDLSKKTPPPLCLVLLFGMGVQLPLSSALCGRSYGLAEGGRVEVWKFVFGQEGHFVGKSGDLIV